MPQEHPSRNKALKMFLELETPAVINAKEFGEKAGYTMTHVGGSGLLGLMRKLARNNAMIFEHDKENSDVYRIFPIDKPTIRDILAGKASANSCKGNLKIDVPPTLEVVMEDMEEFKEKAKVEEINDTQIVPYIEGHAMLIRNQRVMLGGDLARVYGVETRRLNEQRERNPEKFPQDFAFKLDDTETDNWLSQNAIPKDKLGGYNPWAYTLEGCNMAATVLNTPKAIKRSVQIIRTFSNLELMVHGEQPKQSGFAELMQILVEQNKMVTNSLALQGQQLTDSISVLSRRAAQTDEHIETEIIPTIAALETDKQKLQQENEKLKARLFEHENQALQEAKGHKARIICNTMRELGQIEARLLNKHYALYWKGHHQQYGHTLSKKPPPLEVCQEIFQDMRGRVQAHLQRKPDTILHLSDDDKNFLLSKGAWGNFDD